MPDISMCKNFQCPLKDNCYRYVAKPSFHQTYTYFEYKDGCDYHLEFKGSRDILNQLMDIVNE